MIKWIFLGILLVLVTGIGAFIYHESQQKAVIRTSLSERSKEYIKEQSRTNSDWEYLDFDGPQGEDTRNKRIGRKDCYSFVIPYRVTIHKEEEKDCMTRYDFDTPKGYIRAYISATSNTSLGDLGPVLSRRSDTSYSEESKVVNGRQFLIFRLKGDTYESNVFALANGKYFAFIFSTKTNENLDADLDSMLSSLQLSL
jgi:hypothetical protein